MTVITKQVGNRELAFDEERLLNYIQRVTNIDSKHYTNKIVRAIKEHEKYSSESITELLITTALENVDESAPNWKFDASKIYLDSLYKKASRNRSYDKGKKYGDFYGLIKVLAGKGVYSPDILEKYSKEEIKEMGEDITPDRDYKLDYLGLQLMADRYLAKDYSGETYELPQERWMIIAMYLMQDENVNRLGLVKEAYWAMSNLYMTVATPTLSNAGKSGGQLSSCFIDTIEDSLVGIYDSNTDIARLSKNGGGIGVYAGKIRSRGSSIKGFKGVSSGVVPWVKQLNNTAISVDQQGMRKGAVAIYLDVWHMDIEAFLDLKLNNGDERMRAHDIFTGVTLPDLFMEKVENRGDWYLFDPHEVRQVMGYSLEDFYDEEKGSGNFREKYEECVQSNELSKKKVSAIEIMKRVMKSQLETGTPFMFYRDEVNRMNANSHEGMIYCSNLCTEITQNQSPTTQISEKIDENNPDEFIIRKKSGDYVTCNLSSINLAKAVTNNVLERLIDIQVRMLDNVISVNTLPIKQADITNHKYRATGIGTFGWHHLLALKNIHWETEEAVNYSDKLYEKIAFLAIKASNKLAKEKGAYPLFEGSDWETGDYFDKRGYEQSEEWESLRDDVMTHGIRNAYLMAVAPNMSTSMIAGSTASIDPVFAPLYSEEKKDFKIPNTAPDLNHKTYDVYRRSAYILDQRWSVRQNAARQKHIDQSISFNFYVPNSINASVLLNLHLQAWKEGLKTTYYVRSTSSDIEECTWCEG